MSNNAELSPGNIMQMAWSFHRSRILLTAYELDLFTTLGESSKSAKDVADSIGTDERATERLMNALCAIGMLNKNESMFSNTPESSQFLVKGKKSYINGLMHTTHLWDAWGTLTEAVRNGTSVIAQHINDRGEDWLTAFIAAMHERASMQAKGIVSLIDFTDVSTILDVGGGSGAYSMAFVNVKDNIVATVFDLPNVISLTRDYIKGEGLADKIDTIVGDYTTDDLGSGFDLIFLSAIIHSNSYKENMSLIEKCFKALNPNGQVVVQDFIMSEDRTAPTFGAIFSLNMLVATSSGDTYTESEVKRWMEEAGLSGIIKKDTGMGTSLMIGRKIAP